MDEEYDVIVLGTGLTECVISGLLSVSGMKVLHMDRNNYYGGECASLNLNQLFTKLRGPDAKPPATLGSSRDYYIDMVPKFITAAGKMVRMLAYTKVTKYLEFVLVEGSYVYDKKGKVHKVPATDGEALKSSLMGMFEKRRCVKFFSFCAEYEEADPKTHKGIDLKTTPMSEVYKKFDLGEETQQFIGHCIALHLSDAYLEQPALDTIKRIKLYNDALDRFGTSPFLYVTYGLGELPQAFARLSAVYGGTYMLGLPFEEVVYNESGVAVGVKAGGETAKCKMVVGDPSYFPGKTRKTGQVIRTICILDHPVKDTNNNKACQIIIPQKQVDRQNDIYISVISSAFQVAPEGKFIAIVSTKVETANPEQEIKAGLDLLEPILDKFTFVSDTFEPVDDGSASKTFISTSYDATSHLETTADDILALFARITGKELEWDKLPIAAEEGSS